MDLNPTAAAGDRRGASWRMANGHALTRGNRGRAAAPLALAARRPSAVHSCMQLPAPGLAPCSRQYTGSSSSSSRTLLLGYYTRQGRVLIILKAGCSLRR
jgi:hypothetical protein